MHFEDTFKKGIDITMKLIKFIDYNIFFLNMQKRHYLIVTFGEFRIKISSERRDVREAK